MNKFCGRCGAPREPGAKFCIKCGFQLSVESQDQAIECPGLKDCLTKDERIIARYDVVKIERDFAVRVEKDDLRLKMAEFYWPVLHVTYACPGGLALTNRRVIFLDEGDQLMAQTVECTEESTIFLPTGTPAGRPASDIGRQLIQLDLSPFWILDPSLNDEVEDALNALRNPNDPSGRAQWTCVGGPPVQCLGWTAPDPWLAFPLFSVLIGSRHAIERDGIAKIFMTDFHFLHALEQELTPMLKSFAETPASPNRSASAQPEIKMVGTQVLGRGRFSDVHRAILGLGRQAFEELQVNVTAS